MRLLLSCDSVLILVLWLWLWLGLVNIYSFAHLHTKPLPSCTNEFALNGSRRGTNGRNGYILTSQLTLYEVIKWYGYRIWWNSRNLQASKNESRGSSPREGATDGQTHWHTAIIAEMRFDERSDRFGLIWFGYRALIHWPDRWELKTHFGLLLLFQPTTILQETQENNYKWGETRIACFRVDSGRLNEWIDTVTKLCDNSAALNVVGLKVNWNAWHNNIPPRPGLHDGWSRIL